MSSKASTKRVRRQAERHKVVGGYTRLSVDRDGKSIGYDIQREAIQRWADAYGYTVFWYSDPDITAADKNVVRPDYERMLDDLRAGKISAIVVWRLDRLVRLTREFERCFAIIEDAHGFIVDVDQEFTTKSQTGKLIMRLLVILAEMEIASMRTRQLAHQRRKAEDGQYSGGGYRAFGFIGATRNAKNEVTNRGDIGVKHVAKEVRLLRDAARRVAWEGESYSDVVRDWTARSPPIVGTTGRPFTVGTLGDLLTSARVGGFRETETEDPATAEVTTNLHRAVWKPIIERRTWEKLRAMRKSRPEGNQPAATYLLSGGLSICGRCDTRLFGGPRRVYKAQETIPSYRCNACGGISIGAGDLELTVKAQLFTRLQSSPELFDAISAEGDGEDGNELADALREVDECDGELELIANLRALPKNHEDRLDDGEWLAMRRQLKSRKSEASKIVERLSRSASYPVPYNGDRDDLHGWFNRLAPSQRQSFMRTHLRAVYVDKATPGTRVFRPDRVRVIFADAEQAS